MPALPAQNLEALGDGATLLAVKTWGFVALELLALGVAGGFLLLSGPASQLASAWEATSHSAERDARLGPLDLPSVAVTRSPAGTFTGIKDDLLLRPLRTQPVKDVRFNFGGSSISLRVTFADGSRAAFKPLQTNPQTVPRKEIAAYWLNRLLGLNNVPPAAARTLNRADLLGKLLPESVPSLPRLTKEIIFDEEGFTRGEVSYWIPVVVNANLDHADKIEEWTRWLTIGNDIPPEKMGLLAQLSSLLVFDFLENNADRFSGGNMLQSPDRQTLYYMDNTFGFQVEPRGHEKCRAALRRSQKFSRRLLEALRRFDGHALRTALERDPGVLTDEEIASVVARRDVVLGYIDRLIEKYGDERVLVFP
mgnify:FL=1